MIALYLLDIPENRGAIDAAACLGDVTIREIGPYFEVSAGSGIRIDRRATGMRHAVWYSCIAGTAGCSITQWDKNALRAEPL